MCTPNPSAESTNCWDWKKALSAQVKLFHWFIFAFTLVFTLLLLLSLYLFHLRLRRLRRHPPPPQSAANNPLSTAELGLKKELREMLPVIVFKESFSVSDTICSVCLGDYQAEDRLQQIPVCKHVFHVECIDHWLSTHTTCPLCRLSLLASSPTEPEVTNDTIPTNAETGNTSSLDVENCGHSPTNPEVTQ
ncbi:Zinc finger, RING/FYVE/PHD-type [Artemisia annua]|uniref:RING-type E3 ubiquitin transferase n=1 Tax=Artemisia annua TaxID=35608 RepID=A0A2U1LF94_ARTAN|nr:Zinc finger, RING/FYVE/PHD-type [Artemisia annua]